MINGLIPPRGRSGFTLIELLVVVAIMALLLSILLPSLGSAKEQTKAVMCRTNEKGLAQCYFMYASHYGGAITPDIRHMESGYLDTSTGKAYPSMAEAAWWNLLDKYGKLGMNDKPGLAYWIRCPKWKAPYNSYAQNDTLGFKRRPDWMPFRDEPNNFDRLPHPSSLVLMAEYYNTTFGTDLPTNLGNPTSPTDFFYPTPHFGKRFTTSYCDPYYAFGQSNILWSDGHVSTVTWEDGQLTSRNVDPTVP